MSYLEGVQTAIDTLERFRGENWTHHYSIDHGDANSSIQSDDGRVVSDTVVPQYADLIVILHRTMDAQLVILRFAKALYPLNDKTRTEWVTIHNAEALARGINGGTDEA